MVTRVVVQFLMPDLELMLDEVGEDRYTEAVRSDSLEIFHETGNDGFRFFSGQQESHKGIDDNQNFLIFWAFNDFLENLLGDQVGVVCISDIEVFNLSSLLIFELLQLFDSSLSYPSSAVQNRHRYMFVGSTVNPDKLLCVMKQQTRFP